MIEDILVRRKTTLDIGQGNWQFFGNQLGHVLAKSITGDTRISRQVCMFTLPQLLNGIYPFLEHPSQMHLSLGNPRAFH